MHGSIRVCRVTSSWLRALLRKTPAPAGSTRTSSPTATAAPSAQQGHFPPVQSCSTSDGSLSTNVSPSRLVGKASNLTVEQQLPIGVPRCKMHHCTRIVQGLRHLLPGRAASRIANLHQPCRWAAGPDRDLPVAVSAGLTGCLECLSLYDSRPCWLTESVCRCVTAGRTGRADTGCRSCGRTSRCRPASCSPAPRWTQPTTRASCWRRPLRRPIQSEHPEMVKTCLLSVCAEACGNRTRTCPLCLPTVRAKQSRSTA